MFARASVSMAAGADFVVERAIYFVLFSTEDAGEKVRHFEDAKSEAGMSSGSCRCWRQLLRQRDLEELRL